MLSFEIALHEAIARSVSGAACSYEGAACALGLMLLVSKRARESHFVRSEGDMFCEGDVWWSGKDFVFRISSAEILLAELEHRSSGTLKGG